MLGVSCRDRASKGFLILQRMILVVQLHDCVQLDLGNGVQCLVQCIRASGWECKAIDDLLEFVSTLPD